MDNYRNLHCYKVQNLKQFLCFFSPPTVNNYFCFLTGKTYFLDSRTEFVNVDEFLKIVHLQKPSSGKMKTWSFYLRCDVPEKFRFSKCDDIMKKKRLLRHCVASDVRITWTEESGGVQINHSSALCLDIWMETVVLISPPKTLRFFFVYVTLMEITLISYWKVREWELLQTRRESNGFFLSTKWHRWDECLTLQRSLCSHVSVTLCHFELNFALCHFWCGHGCFWGSMLTPPPPFWRLPCVYVCHWRTAHIRCRRASLQVV